MSTYIFLIVILIFIVIKVYRDFSIFKLIKHGNFLLIDGSIKSGKTLTTIRLAIIKTKLHNLFHRSKIYIYSNIPLKCKYVPVTKDMLERKVRIKPKSVVIIDEASLLADSMLYGDKEINEKIQLFCKLFAHYSKGGTLIYNTQSYKDVHFDVKRCTSIYYTIISSKKLLRYVKLELCKVIMVDEQSTFDTEPVVVYIPKKIFKYYDRYTYSEMTDNLPLYANFTIPKSLKTKHIVSFRKFKTFDNRESVSLEDWEDRKS